jgi:dimethylargininase
MVDGLTSADLGKPDYESALVQHGNYVNALRQCGLKVHILDPDPTYPDSTFVGVHSQFVEHFRLPI